MRENRTHGSEGGEGRLFPTPIVACSFRSSWLRQRQAWKYGVYGRSCSERTATGLANAVAAGSDSDSLEIRGLWSVVVRPIATPVANSVATGTESDRPKNSELVVVVLGAHCYVAR